MPKIPCLIHCGTTFGHKYQMKRQEGCEMRTARVKSVCRIDLIWNKSRTLKPERENSTMKPRQCKQKKVESQKMFPKTGPHSWLSANSCKSQKHLRICARITCTYKLAYKSKASFKWYVTSQQRHTHVMNLHVYRHRTGEANFFQSRRQAWPEQQRWLSFLRCSWYSFRSILQKLLHEFADLKSCDGTCRILTMITKRLRCISDKASKFSE